MNWTYPNWAQWVTMLLVLAIFCIVIYIAVETTKDPFSNPNDSQYNNRYVTSGQNPPTVYNGVTYDTNSLQGRLDLATAKGMTEYQAQVASQLPPPAKLSGVSQLTGSRDIPVFFEDYDYDTQQKGGRIYNSREGFGGPKKDCGIPGGCD
jgi:hypothetical protein